MVHVLVYGVLLFVLVMLVVMTYQFHHLEKASADAAEASKEKLGLS
jgi:type II secretory pathway component PulL